MATMNFGDLLYKNNNKTGTEPVENEIVALLAQERENARTGLSIKQVPRKKIVFNKENDYGQEEIESLGNSILRYKLQNIPSGYYDEELDQYILQNGERRTRALDYLLEKYRDCPETEKSTEEYKLYEKNVKLYEKGYPFNINENIEDTEALSEVEKIDYQLRLIDCNTEHRNDQAERARHIQEKKELLEKRKMLTGASDTININKEIAKSEGISERQVQKYNAVATLIPELKELFDSRQLSLNDGAYYANLPEVDQQRIVELLQVGELGSAKEIQALNEKLKEKEAEIEQVRDSMQRDLEKVTNEKNAKEEAISTLVEAAKRQAAEEQARIRTELEEEYRKNAPDPEQISALNTRLLTSEDRCKNAVQELTKEKEKAKKKDDEIKALKKELEEIAKKEDKNTEVEVENKKEKIKAEIIYARNHVDLQERVAAYISFATTNKLLEPEITIHDISELLRPLEELQKKLLNR